MPEQSEDLILEIGGDTFNGYLEGGGPVPNEIQVVDLKSGLRMQIEKDAIRAIEISPEKLEKYPNASPMKFTMADGKIRTGIVGSFMLYFKSRSGIKVMLNTVDSAVKIWREG